MGRRCGHGWWAAGPPLPQPSPPLRLQQQTSPLPPRRMLRRERQDGQQDSLHQLRHALAAAEDQVTAAAASAAATAIASAGSEADTEHLASVMADAAALRQRCERAEADCEALRQEAEAVAAERSSTAADLARLQGQLQRRDAEVAQLRLQVPELRSEVAALRRDLEASAAEVSSKTALCAVWLLCAFAHHAGSPLPRHPLLTRFPFSLAPQAAAAQGQLDEAREAQAGLQQQSDVAAAAQAELREQLREAADARAALQAQVDEQQAAALQRQKEGDEQAATGRQAVEAQQAALQEQLQAAEGHVASLQHRLEEAVAQHAELQQAAQLELAALQQELAASRRQAVRLQSDVSDAELLLASFLGSSSASLLNTPQASPRLSAEDDDGFNVAAADVAAAVHWLQQTSRPTSPAPAVSPQAASRLCRRIQAVLHEVHCLRQQQQPRPRERSASAELWPEDSAVDAPAAAPRSSPSKAAASPTSKLPLLSPVQSDTSSTLIGAVHATASTKPAAAAVASKHAAGGSKRQGRKRHPLDMLMRSAGLAGVVGAVAVQVLQHVARHR